MGAEKISEMYTEIMKEYLVIKKPNLSQPEQATIFSKA